jgi:hypothetical protein
MPDYMLKITPETREWMDLNPDAVTMYEVEFDPGLMMSFAIASTWLRPENRVEEFRVREEAMNATDPAEKERLFALWREIVGRRNRLGPEHRAKVLEHNRPIIQRGKERLVPLIEEIEGVFAVEVNYDSNGSAVFAQATVAAAREIAQIKEVTWVFASVAMSGAPGLKFSIPAIAALPAQTSGGSGGYNAAVGVLDTGVGATTTGTLVTAGDAVFIPGADYAGDTQGGVSLPHDIQRWSGQAGHGTAVAGAIRGDFTIAVQPPPAGQYVGVAPSASVFNARIWKRNTTGTAFSGTWSWGKVKDAVDWVKQSAAQGQHALINFSNFYKSAALEAGSTAAKDYDRQVDWLSHTRDVLWVGIIGNRDPSDPFYDTWSTPRAPGGAVNAVVASAFLDQSSVDPAEFTWWTDNPAFPTSTPAVRKPDISAPGGGVVTCAITANFPDGHATFNGTSFAAPHIAGTAALVHSVAQMPSATSPLLVRTILINSTGCSRRNACGPIHLPGLAPPIQWEPKWGWGVLNAEEAVRMAKQNSSETHEGDVGQGAAVSLYLRGPIKVPGFPTPDRYRNVTLCWEREFHGSSFSTDIPISQLDIEIWHYHNGAPSQTPFVLDPDTVTAQVYNTKMIRGFEIPFPMVIGELTTALIRVKGISVDSRIGGNTGLQKFMLACNWPMYPVAS